LKLQQEKEIQPTIVAMTAYSLKEDERRFLQAGLDDYISKPIRAKHIICKVEDILSGQKKRHSIHEEHPTEAKIVNDTVVRQLEKFGGKEMIVNAFKEFEDEALKQIAECDLALEKSEFDIIQKNLHTLKGSAGTLGIERVAKIAEQAEGAMKLQDYSNLSKGLKDLNHSFAEFRKNLTNIISNY
jgi:HPt (histidine-containing phosphotransfer) domain-containing protein